VNVVCRVANELRRGGRLYPWSRKEIRIQRNSETDPREQRAQATTVRDQKGEVLSTRRDKRACRQCREEAGSLGVDASLRLAGGETKSKLAGENH
jgi:hypothetical protein